MSNEIKTLLEDTINSANLTPLFQPIVCTDTPSLHGYEALIRGPSDTPLHSPLQLFDAAIKHNLLSELELICRKVSIKKFIDKGRYFFKLSLVVLLAPK